MAAKLESDVALRRQGLIDPTAGRLASYERMRIRDHISDFQAALMAKGNTAKHVDL